MSISFLLLSFVLGISLSSAATPNPKRGLVFVESPDAGINSIWRQDGSPLTWYYNYMSNESSTFAATSQQDFEFVPMYWGAGDVNDTSFLANITGLVKSGLNITHVLGFNQPDLSWSEGGSNLSTSDAARLWVNNFIPLQEMGIKIGLPVVNAKRDPGNWTVPFLDNCTSLIREQSGDSTKDCPFDFVPIHAFGNLSALTDRVETFSKSFNKPIWITEYADNDQDLATTQAFFNASLKYLDGADVVERYAYFGAFRSDVSNVGPNAAMLDAYNRLTDIGSWYLGGNATGNLPTYDTTGAGGQGSGNGDGDGTTSCSAEHPCGKGNGGSPEMSAATAAVVMAGVAGVGLLSEFMALW